MSQYKQINYPLSVAWDSTVKTVNFTAEKTLGYFVNTTSGQITVTLPASPSIGDYVGIKDYAGTFGTNKCVISGNGANIQGVAADSALKTNRAAAILVYVDSTQGWIYQQQSNASDNIDKLYVTASGGTETTCGDYKIHTFNSSGTFTVTCAGNCAGSNVIDYMVIAGGAGGGGRQRLSPSEGTNGAGGGAGGFRESVPASGAWTASPLANPGGSLPVSVTAYPVTVGGGGAGGPGIAPRNGSSGNPSTFSSITSSGGGYGGGGNCPGGNPGGSGGSGGGGAGGGSASGGSGNTPPVSPPQGNNGGGHAGAYAGGGGGGASSAGSNAGAVTGGNGGNGVDTSITGSPFTYSGGGGGGQQGCTSTPAAPGGGGPGPAGAGGANRGGGGGGYGNGSGQPPGAGGAGGSGKVVIRYKFQN